MAIDIQDHELVPEHRKMNDEEVDELLERFNAEKQDLPKIKDSDPVARKLDVEPGDVIHIKRDSPTAGEADYYRVVVQD